MVRKRLTAIFVCIALTFSLTGCSDKKEAGTILIYDGKTSEMQLVHRMVKLMVEEHTDLTVELGEEMSSVNCYNELVKGNCDLMNSYDGTLLTTFLKLDPKDVPEGSTLYDFANEQAMTKSKVRLLGKLGINNTYAIAAPQHIVDKYNLNKVSDLVPVAGELIFGAEHEFFSQEGSMKYGPFVEFYGLNFKEGKAVDLGLKYAAVESGNIDVTVAYATDGLNKKAQLKILEDDQAFFPEYNGALLVRDDLFARFKDTAPDLEELLNKLSGTMTNDIMVELTYATDVENKDIMEVAKGFLQSQNLIA